MENIEYPPNSSLEETQQFNGPKFKTINELNDVEMNYLNEVGDNPMAYFARLEELGIDASDSSYDSMIDAKPDMLSDKDFQEIYDDCIPPLKEIEYSLKKGQELSIEELREIRPDLADYIDRLKARLHNNEYAQSITAYYCENGDFILSGKDSRPRQESNYAIVRGADIYCWAGNAKGDGHLNEFANNTDGFVPNSRYHFENATYVINDLGQVKTVYEYHITSRSTDRNEDRGELKTVCDAKGGLLDDVGGHIVAHSIDGATESINIVPMNDAFNNGKDWKAMEFIFKTEYSEGRSFTVKKDIQYDSESGRPNHIDVEACVKGERMNWAFDLP